MLFEYFFIGLAVGFIFYELTGISPGGVIAPAYFALFVNQPSKIVMTLILALIVWGILELLTSRLILYGRRRLLLALLLGFGLKVVIERWVQPMPLFAIDLQSIGYIIPGLIANEIARQKLVVTLSGLGIVTVVTYLIILLIK